MTDDRDAVPPSDVTGPTDVPLAAAAPSWKVLVVDADPMTARRVDDALAGFRHDGRSVTVLRGCSTADAQVILRDHPDIAAVFIDPVLETADAGLRLVTMIRRGLGNPSARVILCPAYADAGIERLSVENYEINVLRTKTELSSEQIRLTVLETLRIIDKILDLEANREGIARLSAASSGLFDFRTPRFFYANFLIQLNSIAQLPGDAVFCLLDHGEPEAVLRVQGGTGRFRALSGHVLDRATHPTVAAALADAEAASRVMQGDAGLTLPFPCGNGITGFAFLGGYRHLTPLDWQLLDLFRTKAASALGSFLLLQEAQASQRAVVQALAQIAEFKDVAAPGHLKRIQRVVTETARTLHAGGEYRKELTDEAIERIGLASMLHDIGMISVPDEMLHTFGELTDEQLQVYHRHTEIGRRILLDTTTATSGRNALLIAAAEIAGSHHERFDGSGYPHGLKGTEIPLSGRIVAIADMFDALISNRYQETAWPVPAALRWVEEQAGTDFDPVVVRAFVSAVRRIEKDDPDWRKGTEAARPARRAGLFARIRSALGIGIAAAQRRPGRV